MLRYLLIISIFLPFSVLSQHSTINFSSQPFDLNQQSLLMVPLQKKMFITDINRSLAKHNQMTSEEIVDRFANAIDQVMRYQFETKCTVSSFYLIENEEAESDLLYIYENIGLEYELVSKTEEKKGIDKLKEKLKKKKDDSYYKGGINNGEIITKRDDRERYMKTTIRDQKMLDSVHFKFDNRFVLFVNELDIRNVIGTGIEMQNMDFEREIKLHYSLYHINGEILSTGVSRTTFPSTLNDINSIIKDYFPILAAYIFEDLFPPEEEEEKSKISLNPWKN